MVGSAIEVDNCAGIGYVYIYHNQLDYVYDINTVYQSGWPKKPKKDGVIHFFKNVL